MSCKNDHFFSTPSPDPGKDKAAKKWFSEHKDMKAMFKKSSQIDSFIKKYWDDFMQVEEKADENGGLLKSHTRSKGVGWNFYNYLSWKLYDLCGEGNSSLHVIFYVETDF